MLMFDSSVKLLEFMKFNTVYNNSAMDEQPITSSQKDLRGKSEIIDESFRTLSKLMLMEYFYMGQSGNLTNQSLIKAKSAVIDMVLEKGFLDDLYEISLKTKDYELVCRLNFMHGYREIDLEKHFHEWDGAQNFDVDSQGGFLDFWVNYAILILKNEEPELIPSQIATRQVSKYLRNHNTQYVAKAILAHSPQIKNLLNDSCSDSTGGFISGGKKNVHGTNILQSSMQVLNLFAANPEANEAKIRAAGG